MFISKETLSKIGIGIVGFIWLPFAIAIEACMICYDRFTREIISDHERARRYNIFMDDIKISHPGYYKYMLAVEAATPTLQQLENASKLHH